MDLTSLDTGGTTWEQSAQGWGTMLLDRYTAANFVPPSQTPMANTQKGSTGQTYTEGKPNAIAATLGGFHLSPMVLLGGVVLVAAVLYLRKG